MNNTQIASVAVDTAAKKIRYGFYNSSEQLCDYTVGEAAAYKYARTVNTSYECLYIKQSWEDTFVPFLPDVSEAEGWTKMDDAYVHGRLAEHYRLVNDYVVEPGDQFNYTEVRTYQQEFYCIRDKSGCTPLKWYMTSKSNFASHYDIYIIEYSDFEPSVSESDFDFYDFGGEAECPAEPVDPNDDGPTMNRMVEVFRIRSHAHKVSPVVQSNLEKISAWRKNKNFTFTVAPNHFIDREYKEVIKARTGKRVSAPIATPFSDEYYLDTPLAEDIPTNFDWRTQGILTYVKD